MLNRDLTYKITNLIEKEEDNPANCQALEVLLKQMKGVCCTYHDIEYHNKREKANYAGYAAHLGKLGFIKIIGKEMPEQLWQYMLGSTTSLKTPLEIATEKKDQAMLEFIKEKAKEEAKKGKKRPTGLFDNTEPFWNYVISLEESNNPYANIINDWIATPTKLTDLAIFAPIMATSNMLLRQFGVLSSYSSIGAFFGSSAITYLLHQRLKNWLKEHTDDKENFESKLQFMCSIATILSFAVSIALNRDDVGKLLQESVQSPSMSI